MVDLQGLAASAAQVGAEYEESRVAIAAADEADAALLARVVETVKPSLRALSSRIKKSYRCWWPDNVSTASEETHFAKRGVCVCGDGPEYDHPRANRGEYEGWRLYLLDDGTFAHVAYGGSWSKWQGEADSWDATLEAMTFAEVIAHNHTSEKIAAALSEKLAKAAGSRTKAIATEKRRAETLRSIASLAGAKVQP